MFENYESLPVKVKAVQLTDKNKDMVFNELTGNSVACFYDGIPCIEVTTIHGEKALARIGDYIVKESKKGFYYPVKPDIFHKRYIKFA